MIYGKSQAGNHHIQPLSLTVFSVTIYDYKNIPPNRIYSERKYLQGYLVNNMFQVFQYAFLNNDNNMQALFPTIFT